MFLIEIGIVDLFVTYVNQLIPSYHVPTLFHWAWHCRGISDVSQATNKTQGNKHCD